MKYTYQINHNKSGWYYDILDENGLEVDGGHSLRSKCFAHGIAAVVCFGWNRKKETKWAK